MMQPAPRAAVRILRISDARSRAQTKRQIKDDSDGDDGDDTDTDSDGEDSPKHSSSAKATRTSSSTSQSTSSIGSSSTARGSATSSSQSSSSSTSAGILSGKGNGGNGQHGGNQNGKHRLGKGAIAAIVVPLLFALLLAALVVRSFRRRAKKRRINTLYGVRPGDAEFAQATSPAMAAPPMQERHDGQSLVFNDESPHAMPSSPPGIQSSIHRQSLPPLPSVIYEPMGQHAFASTSSHMSSLTRVSNSALLDGQADGADSVGTRTRSNTETSHPPSNFATMPNPHDRAYADSSSSPTNLAADASVAGAWLLRGQTQASRVSTLQEDLAAYQKQLEADHEHHIHQQSALASGSLMQPVPEEPPPVYKETQNASREDIDT